jgi:hypothetical protein
MAAHSNLIEWLEQTHERGLKPYLLIDTAQVPASQGKLARWKLPHISLSEQTPEQPLIEIAPLLIPLVHVPVELTRMVCDWAMDLAYGAPCLCWMSSRLAAEELAEHLRKFHTVRLSDGETMMMRWYDTRILPVWMACLSPAQATQFTAGIGTLQYVDRFGAVSVLHDAEPVGGIPAPPPFGEPLVQLSDQQFGMLVDASDTDVLVSHLRRVITDETNALTPPVLFEFVGKYQQRAATAGIRDIDRQTQYLLLALFTSGKGVEHTACIELLKKPPESLDEFSRALQALPSSVWEAGPPLWSRSSSSGLTMPHGRRTSE